MTTAYKYLDWPLMRNNVTRADLDAVIEYLQQDDPGLTQGFQVDAFEKEWSEWVGVKHSVFVNSGSSANLLTMAALKERYGSGDVIVPPLTWVSDIASVLQNGLNPVFVDINLRTLGMDSSAVASRITGKTRAVFLTHVLGYNALDTQLLALLEETNIPLIEDVCESYGGTFRGKKLGSFGIMSDFSFFYAHHLSTIEGGMISTSNRDLYEVLRMMRSHGMVRESSSEPLKRSYAERFTDLSPDFIFAFPSYNVRSTEINAIIGRSQLRRLDDQNRIRKDNLAFFLANLDSEKYFTGFEQEGNCNYALTLVLREPDENLCGKVIQALRSCSVEFRRGTSGGGNQLRQPYLRKRLGDEEFRNYPNVDHIHFFGFYIGNYPCLEREKIADLCSILNAL